MRQPIRLLLGGSFDPVHYGHMRLALECQAQFPGSTFEFLPAFRSPLKDETRSSAQQRLTMLELAVAELNQLSQSSAFSVNAVEIDNPGVSYTVETLAGFRSQCPDDGLVWIMGADSWAQFDRWHRWQELPKFASLVVVTRPQSPLEPSQEVAELGKSLRPLAASDTSPGGITFLSTTPMAISSTLVRSLVSAGKSAAFLVSNPVHQYIQANRLYI